MSSIIMHLYMGYRLQQELEFSDEFLLGSILPDILKCQGFTRKQTHYLKYLCYLDGIKSLPDINYFLKENKGTIADDIVKGYLAHLIEDNIWFSTYIPKLAEKRLTGHYYPIDKSIHKRSEFRSDIYHDYIIIDKMILDKHHIELETLKNKILGIKCNPDISKEIIENLRLRSVEDNNFRILDYDLVEAYLEAAVKEVLYRFKTIY